MEADNGGCQVADIDLFSKPESVHEAEKSLHPLRETGHLDQSGRAQACCVWVCIILLYLDQSLICGKLVRRKLI